MFYLYIYIYIVIKVTHIYLQFRTSVVQGYKSSQVVLQEWHSSQAWGRMNITLTIMMAMCIDTLVITRFFI